MSDYRPPDTTTYDVHEVPPDAVTVGLTHVFGIVNEETVLSIGPEPTTEADPMWIFFWADGFAFIPDPVLGPDWAATIEERSPDPVLRDTGTMTDGSVWVYWADELGGYWYCYTAGTDHAAGDVTRGDEPLYHPVPGPADVVVGTRYRFVVARVGVVDSILEPGDPSGYPDAWAYQCTTAEGSEEITVPVVLPDYLTIHIWAQVPKPAAGSMWQAADRSEWVWPGGVPFYRCYAAGDQWSVDSCAAAEQIGALVAVV